LSEIFVAAQQAGFPLNKDVNSGNPIGMGMGTVSIYKGQRLTGASTYLSDDPPDNLAIKSNALVARVLFEGEKAVGVETVAGEVYQSKLEVVLAEGALNTPQTLMLSGVGPAEELRAHGIKPLIDLPLVGRNLQDHCFSAVGVVLDRAPSNVSQSPSPMGWFKLSQLSDTPECQLLPEQAREHRLKGTVPDIEIATVGFSSQENKRRLTVALSTLHHPLSATKTSL
jgi:choline dehydrogenase-like flavoprotein